MKTTEQESNLVSIVHPGGLRVTYSVPRGKTLREVLKLSGMPEAEINSLLPNQPPSSPLPRPTVSLPASKAFQHLQAHPNGFIWKGDEIQFNRVTHLQFQRIATAQYRNFVKVGEPTQATLVITIDSGEEITVSIDEGGFLFGWNSNKSSEIQSLTDFYLYLAENSFRLRLGRYLDEVNAKGYFTYDECQFYPRQKIVFRGEEFPLGSSDFVRSPGYVELKHKFESPGDKIKRAFSFGKPPQFNTQTNTDVIFCLLENLFDLRWEK